MAVSSSLSTAIIGAGASGTLCAANLLRRATNPTLVRLADRSGEPGRGVAFGTVNPGHLLNVPAGRMSAWPDRPDDFVHWLQQNESAVLEGKPDPSRVFAPRPSYRRYLQSVLADAESRAATGVTLERISDEAISVETASPGFRIIFAAGRTVAADRVVLTSGYSSPKDPPVENTGFYQSPRYVANAWTAGAVERIGPAEPVLLIGAGLTMVDVAVALQANGHRGSILAISRHGIFPLAHGPSAVHTGLLSVDRTTATTRALVRRLRDEVRTARAANGQDWRGVVDAQRPISTALWQNLPSVEKRRFLRHAMPYWEVHRHRIAPEVASVIDGLHRSGQLAVMAGHVRDLRENEGGVDVTIRQRGRSADTVIRVGVVINCTGASLDYRVERPAMIDSLIGQGLARPNELGFGLDSAPNGAVLDSRGEPTPGLFTVGVLRKGDLWESTAIPELRAQAAALG
ncbi:MAG TPA: FAD/NAD(P)-binding protein, partial [Chloroflexota bacterium]|nr:FAD/NAD(P)-binding protein [Chloroflexota bacterium]